ncbi:unnamed protein product [Urochloa humidicola]
MSKQPGSPPSEGGGVPPIRARGGADATPSPSPPGTGRTRKASAQGERQAVAGSLRDGAETSAAAMATHGGDGRRVTLVVPGQEGGQPQQVMPQYQRDGRNGAPTPPPASRPKPSYVPPSQRRREQPPADLGQPYPLGGVGIPEERQQSMLPPRGGAPPPVAGSGVAIPGGAALPPAAPARPKRSGWGRRHTASWAPDVADPSDARRHPPPRQQTPGDDEAAPPGSLTTPGGGAALPSGGGGAALPSGGGGAALPFGGGGAALPSGGGGAAPPSGRKGYGYYGFGRRPTATWAPDVADPSDARRHPPPRQQTPGDDEAAAPGSLTKPGGGAALPSGEGGAAPPSGRKGYGYYGFGSKRPTATWAPDVPDPSDARRPRPRPGGDEEEAPPHGGSPTPPEGPPRTFGIGLPTVKTIERVSTLDKGYGTEAAPAPPGGRPPLPSLSPSPSPPRGARPQQPTPPSYHQPPPYYGGGGKKWQAEQPSPMLPTERRRRKENSKKPLAFLFTLCCILFWLLVVCIGLAILVIYLLYHPKPPRVHVSTATLNAGYIDELPPPHLGQLALNSDLYVLAAIYNPNTKIDVVLRYMQFDLYFQGHLIGTQAVWPPLYERPGDSALRSVHLVVSEVIMRPEDADVWRNATAGGGGLLQLQLEGRWLVQLNFGRWLPFRYMVKPSCTLWLDPPPAGALRRARCHQ